MNKHHSKKVFKKNLWKNRQQDGGADQVELVD